ncbi:GNAT family N-acetyltransferase [Jeotgalibacillus sp. JSM ZJ347]|uniref:GNAT family N-acetyltransferase n=1 Tax=Jeotgalibacillus sp. JSM ZJ347 TaxID=3342117 RepID=UPI0035A9623E
MEWSKKHYIVSDDVELLDVESIYQMLVNTYWASNRTRKVIEQSIKHSISFGMYEEGKQIGFARVVTDRVVFSWIMDVVIDADYRGKGLGEWLMDCVLEHPDIKYTAIALATSDAQDFYRKFKFRKIECMTRPIVERE